MKKFLSLLLLLTVGGGITSCSNDDPAPAPDPVPVAQPAPVASQIEDDSFTVSWEAVEGAASYVYSLQHKNDRGSITPIVPETATDELSASFTGLIPSTEYTFRIKAVGAGELNLDSEWFECSVTTEAPAYLSGPWVEIDEISYQKHAYMSTYCYINVTFKTNDLTATYYATVMNGTYFDDEPDNPDFEPNTEEDLKAYLLGDSPVSDDKIRSQNYWGREVIIGMIGVDAAGNPGKLNWTKIQIPTKSEFEGGNPDEQSEASVRIQHVVINSSELEGAPTECFATVYRFQVVDGARSFRYEDGYYAGDFAKQEPAYWRDYFTSISNAYGEGYDGYYSGWKSSMELEGGYDDYYYDATFWSAEMANETYELIFLALDSDNIPGAPGCYEVTLPAELPAISEQTDPAAYRAAVAAANRILRERKAAIPYRR